MQLLMPCELKKVLVAKIFRMSFLFYHELLSNAVQEARQEARQEANVFNFLFFLGRVGLFQKKTFIRQNY